MTHKIGQIVITTILSLCSILFSWLFVNCINLYNSFDVQYSELVYEQLTFDRYETIPMAKSGDLYEIYFEEYDHPFEVSSITQKELNKKELTKLTEGTIFNVFYRDSDSKKYEFEICEMKSDTIIILTLTDFVRVNQNNQIVGMILCPILVGMVIFLIVIFIKLGKSKLIPYNKKYNVFNSNNLGKLKIEYKSGNNIVQIYNSPEVCSLVINDKVIDQYFGLVASTFTLKGEIVDNGKVVLIEAKMGYVNMKLYYDGKLVKRIFMGLG